MILTSLKFLDLYVFFNLTRKLKENGFYIKKMFVSRFSLNSKDFFSRDVIFLESIFSYKSSTNISPSIDLNLIIHLL